jgi:hypothetical protein
MALKRSFLVIANVTARSDELLGALQSKATEGPCAFMLIVPATPFGGGRAAAREQLQEALESLRAAGLEAEGDVGDGDPIIAVTEAWDPRRYDEIVVSTLPMKYSKWMHAGLPERMGKITGAPVTHVVSSPPKPEAPAVPAPAHEKQPLGPLTVLGWGGAKRR